MFGTRVLGDNSIVFEYHNHDAGVVGIAGEFSNWDAIPMNRDANGLWTVRTNPIHPGDYRYLFFVDGVWVNDQRNFRSDPDSGNSFVSVGGYRGSLYKRSFYSPSLGKHKNYVIYLPPSYFYTPEKQYSSVYLLCGLMDSEIDWTKKGYLDHTLDQLVAGEKIYEMIVIMPDKDDTCFHPETYGAFAGYLSNDLIAHIDHEFRTIQSEYHRGIDGLSLGAGWAMRLGTNLPHIYTSISGMSGGYGADIYHAVLENGDLLRAKGVRIQLSVGEGEQDMHPSNYHLKEFLERQGLYCELWTNPGEHDWPLWVKAARDSMQFHSYSFNRL